MLIQIPVYNEGWEVKEAALAAMGQDYPSEKFSIQIVDDSELIDPLLVDYLSGQAKVRNVAFSYINRPHRIGFKAGAMNYGLQSSNHDLVAIVDADFILSANFLKLCCASFVDPSVSCVQTKWSYRNRNESAVTLMQAAIFDSIFVLEQSSRSIMKFSAFFVGSSGVWRRDVIDELGGWRENPFTAEDIDLSLRSYAKGYRCVFLNLNLSSCEATDAFVAFKNQQQRWARGVIQAGIHNFVKVLTARQSRLSRLVEISTIFQNLFPTFILAIGLVLTFQHFSHAPSNYMISPLGLCLLLVAGPTSISIVFATFQGQEQFTLKTIINFLGTLLLSVGMAWAIVSGLVQVLFGSKMEFIVTPKGKNSASKRMKREKWFKHSYIIAFLELSTFLYFLLFLFLLNIPPEYYFLFIFLAVSGLYSFGNSFFQTSVERMLQKKRRDAN